MKKSTGSALCLGLLTWLGATGANAASHILAYSKAESIQVFVDFGEGQPWCKETLELRFVFGGEPDNAAIARLIPKTGNLLERKCPKAMAFDWRSVDRRGQSVANGTASRDTDWTIQMAGSGAAGSGGAASDVAAPSAASPSIVAPPTMPIPPAQNATIRSAPATDSDDSVADNPRPPTAVAGPSTREEIDLKRPAITPIAIRPPLIAAVSEPPSSDTDLPAPSPDEPSSESYSQAPNQEMPGLARSGQERSVPPAVPAPPPLSAIAQPNPPAATFSVAGWLPPSEDQALAAASFLVEVKDQQGCRFRIGFRGEDPTQYLTAKSTGLECGADGYGTGDGQLLLSRADGVKFATYVGSFHRGMPFSSAAPLLPVVAFDARRAAYLLLASDPANQVIYLLKADYIPSGMWNMSSPTLIAVTENQNVFRQLDSIRNAVMFGTERLDNVAPKVASVDFFAVNDWQRGVMNNEQSAWLYTANVTRNWRSKAWEFNPQTARNYWFSNQAKNTEQQRLVDQQRLSEEQSQRVKAAVRAQQQLQLFERLQNDSRDPKKSYAWIFQDANYSPTSGGSYGRLLAGGTADFTQVVHIRGDSGGLWLIDYPYEALLDASRGDLGAKIGWFLLKGKVSLDLSKHDAADLPVTRIVGTRMRACNLDGCADLRDPLNLVREQFDDPNWTPEGARDAVEQAGPLPEASQGARP